MADLLKFFGEHVFLAFCAILGVGVVTIVFIEGSVNLANRVIRHFNIRKAGWPPNNLDADGDPVKPHKP